MAGLLGDLISNAQTLAAQSVGLQITGKNLANVNNPAYSNESVVFSSGALGTTESLGVTASSVQQARSSMLDAQVASAASQSGYSQSLSDNLNTAQTYLDEQLNSSNSATSLSSTGSSGTSGISSALSNFFNSFSNLAANPTDPTAQGTVVEQAGELVSQFNTTVSQLQTLQGGITTQTASDVTTANGLLSNIATLNGQIAQANVNSPNSALDLVDQRQADIEQLSQYMNVTTQSIPNSNGQIRVLSQDGSGNSVVLVSKTNVEGGGLTFNGTQFSGGAASTTLSLQSGSLAGGIAARDGTIQQLINNVQTTAQQLTSAVNTAYNPTGNFFQSSPSSGVIALDPTLSSSTLKTTNTGNAGANELAVAVAGVANQTFSTSGGDMINGTISGYYSQTVSNFGQAVSNAQSQSEDQSNIQQLLTSQRDSVSGVDQDQELTNLMQYERAYQGTSEVINVLDTLLGTVVTSLMS